jgi:hypothetical protein
MLGVIVVAAFVSSATALMVFVLVLPVLLRLSTIVPFVHSYLPMFQLPADLHFAVWPDSLPGKPCRACAADPG